MFYKKYLFIDCSVCGGKYFTITGTIRSPNWPQEYSINKDCEWFITVQTGKQVELVINTFELEGGSSTCFDHLEIRFNLFNAKPLTTHKDM